MKLGHAPVSAIALCIAVGAVAATPTDEDRSIERIRAERAAADAAYVQQVQECRQRFVVTSCIDDARSQRHAAHTRLDRDQQALDEARRQQRAAQRLQAIEAKTSGAEAQRRAQAALERSASRPSSDEARPLPVPASAAPPRSPKPAPDSARRAEQEARARAAYELKQFQAEAHRLDVARRNQERARKANPGVPLPVPAASAVAAEQPGSAASAAR